MFDDESRPTCSLDIGRIERHAHVMVDRGGQVTWCDGTVLEWQQRLESLADSAIRRNIINDPKEG